MWVKLGLCGIVLSLQVNGYQKTGEDSWYDTWCAVDFSVTSEPWLCYHMHNEEVLLASEIDHLSNALHALLHGRLSAPMNFSCVEPDFNFVLNPQKGGCMDWKISFWHNGLTANYLSVELGRADIESLYIYLMVITGAIKPDAPEVIRQRNQGIISDQL